MATSTQDCRKESHHDTCLALGPFVGLFGRWVYAGVGLALLGTKSRTRLCLGVFMGGLDRGRDGGRRPQLGRITEAFDERGNTGLGLRMRTFNMVAVGATCTVVLVHISVLGLHTNALVAVGIDATTESGV